MSDTRHQFALHVLKELEGLIDPERLTTKVRYVGLDSPHDPSVMMVDSRTGAEIVEDRFPTQIENKAAALLGILKKERE